MSDQIPFGTNDFAENPEPRCPRVLLLDTSGSMHGPRIAALNEGIQTFKNEIIGDSLAAKRVEVAVITFGPVQTIQDFVGASFYQPVELRASGDTPMGAAILEALDIVKLRKETYRHNGIAFYRPWIFLITDGGPTDTWSEAAARIREGEAAKAFAFFAVGVEEARMEILRQIAVREPLKLQGLKFRELFQWLSNSMKSVSRSTPGDEVPLANPTGPGGWASI
jgi:uncharacterized protein YegL